MLCHCPTGLRLVGWLRIDNRAGLRQHLDMDTGQSGDLWATDGGLACILALGPVQLNVWSATSHLRCTTRVTVPVCWHATSWA